MTTIDVMTRFWSFYRIRKLKFCSCTRLISENYTSLDLCVIDFRSYLVCVRPCLCQCTGLNWKMLMLISPQFSFVFRVCKGHTWPSVDAYVSIRVKVNLILHRECKTRVHPVQNAIQGFGNAVARVSVAISCPNLLHQVHISIWVPSFRLFPYCLIQMVRLSARFLPFWRWSSTPATELSRRAWTTCLPHERRGCLPAWKLCCRMLSSCTGRGTSHSAWEPMMPAAL